jgi:phage terminase large subunit-like protein
MTTWAPKEDDSPDRVDALVWALTELSGMQAEMTPVPDPFIGW